MKAEGGKIVQNRGKEETDGETDGEGDDSRSDKARYKSEAANYARMNDQMLSILDKLALPRGDALN